MSIHCLSPLPSRPLLSSPLAPLVLHSPRALKGRIVESEHRINMTHTAAVSNRELIVRYNTSLLTGSTFYTDLNSFQMARRDRPPFLTLRPPPILLLLLPSHPS